MKRLLVVIVFLMLLMGCTSVGKITKVEYIKPIIPPLPAKVEYYSVIWQREGNLYCMDDLNAKALLKNKILQDGREAELEAIINGLNSHE